MQEIFSQMLEKSFGVGCRSECVAGQNKKQWHMKGEDNISGQGTELYGVADDNQ